jgi:hypothetical protein
MPRPKGSKNKPKFFGSVFGVDETEEKESEVIEEALPPQKIEVKSEVKQNVHPKFHKFMGEGQ